jgi:hypothetical protein
MSGIYKLTCPDCNKAYIGQIGRPFAFRFREHFRYYIYDYKSKFAQHLLGHHHSIGPINTIKDTLPITTKGRMINTMEKFHIYKETLKATKSIINAQLNLT